MDHLLLEIVAYPVCNAKLNYDKDNSELGCKFHRLAYPIKDGIPVLLEPEARTLSPDEVK